jgi:CspA family cold shock protein
MDQSVVAGKIVRFDRGRGYGFIAPDSGGEDVFVHAKELDGLNEVSTGTRVQFSVIDGGRGLKAYGVRVIDDRTRPARPPAAPADDREDDMCEVLSEAEFARAITDVLLAVTPEATGAQIMEIRRRMTEFASRHGWLE